jgi:hypothetical protein
MKRCIKARERDEIVSHIKALLERHPMSKTTFEKFGRIARVEMAQGRRL